MPARLASIVKLIVMLSMLLLWSASTVFAGFSPHVPYSKGIQTDQDFKTLINRTTTFEQECSRGVSQSLELDGVELTICLPFQPGSTVIASENDWVQSAGWAKYDKNQEFTIYAIPFGIHPASDRLPLASPGIAAKYKEATSDLYQTEKIDILAEPTIHAFGELITGTIYLLPNKTMTPFGSLQLVAEWVFEAGERVWVVRYISPYYPDDKSSQVINTLSEIRLETNFINAPSISLRLQKDYVPEQAPKDSTGLQLDDLPFPSWWNGDCNVNNHPGSYPLGSSYRGAKACGPRGSAWAVDFGEGVLQLEWQCAEYSKRYLYLAYDIAPYSAHGKDVVWNYSGTRLEKITNGTPNKGPVPGDVLSYNGPTSYGHTSVVSAANIDGNGNGSITIVEQNYSPNGSRTHNVSNWYVQSSEGVSGWLHDGQTGGAGNLWTANYYDDHTRWWDNNNSSDWRCSETLAGQALDKNYGSGSPCGRIYGDIWVGDYSARITFGPANYVFRIEHDDGLKVWLDNQNIADRGESGSSYICPARYISGDKDLRVMLREDWGDAKVKVTWTTDASVCNPSDRTLFLPMLIR